MASLESGQVDTTAELRAAHFDGPDELLWLPKLRLAQHVGDWRLAMAMAMGLAAQPAVSKELLNECDGVPAAQNSRTRAWGAETQLRGQIGRAVGTVSYSSLRSWENLDGNAGGWLPTATDQRHTATAYLEVRMDLCLGWLQASRFHIRLLLGSGFPFTPQFPVMDEDGVITAVVEGERHAQRDDGYIRFDIGMTQFFRIGPTTAGTGWFDGAAAAWFGAVGVQSRGERVSKAWATSQRERIPSMTTAESANLAKLQAHLSDSADSEA